MKLKDRVAVVTGGGSGIGAQICREFAKQGACVAVTDLQFDSAKKIANEICNSKGIAKAWAFDVSLQEQVIATADKIEKEFGNIRIWVNNAGVSYVMPFLECTEEIWDKTIRVNLKGTFNGCQVAIRHMLAHKQGVILNMSSQSGKVGNSQYEAYCASKFGIIGLTQSLAVEFASADIRINALCPGVVFTSLWDSMINDYAKKRNMKPEQVKPYFESKIPIGRLCSVEDVAKTAVFLASDDAAYITGQAINISGGAVMY